MGALWGGGCCSRSNVQFASGPRRNKNDFFFPLNQEVGLAQAEEAGLGLTPPESGGWVRGMFRDPRERGCLLKSWE